MNATTGFQENQRLARTILHMWSISYYDEFIVRREYRLEQNSPVYGEQTIR